MELTGYGRSTGFCVDPIEKKPLNHFLPGSSVLSFGTAGCNLACAFCQNWDISKSREVARLSSAGDAGDDRRARPSASAAPASPTPITIQLSSWNTRSTRRPPVGRMGSRTSLSPRASSATSRASDCLRHGRGQRRSQGLYRALLREALRRVAEAGAGDAQISCSRNEGVDRDHDASHPRRKRFSDEEIEALTYWIADELKADVPLHFTAFHPDYRMLDTAATPACDAAEGAQHRASQRPSSRLYWQRP